MKKNMRNDYNGGKKLSMKQSILWNSWGSMFYLGCQWLLTILVVRISGVDNAGLLSLAMSVSNIWYSLAVYGMRNFQVSDTNGKYSNGLYISSRIFTGSAALFGCIIYTLVLSYSPEQKLCIIIYFVYKLSEALFDVFAGIYQKMWRLDYVGKSFTIRGVLTLGTFSAALFLSGNLVITLLIMTVCCLLSVCLYDIHFAGKITNIRICWDKKKIKELLIECFPLVVYTMLSTAIGTIPRLFIERYLGNYKLGIYGSVATPTLIIQMGATYIFNPFVTLFAERYHQKNKKGFLNALFLCSASVAGLAVAGVIGGKLLGKWGLGLLLGEEVAAHSDLLIPLILCTVLTAFAWLLCDVLTAIRDFKGLVAGNAAAVAVSYFSSVIMVKRYDMQGGSVALALATIVEIIFLALCLARCVHENFAVKGQVED